MAEELGWAVTLEHVAFPVEVIATGPRLESKLSDDELDLTEALQSVKNRCRQMGLSEEDIKETDYKVELVLWAYGPKVTEAVRREHQVDSQP